MQIVKQETQSNYTVTTLLRFHDIAGLLYLERAIQSLHSQKEVSVKPIIICQDLSDEDCNKVSDMVNDNWYFPEHVSPTIINIPNHKNQDLRSKLINIGIKAHYESRNDYLAFLDYDDYLYSHAYYNLCSEAYYSGAVFAFATVDLVKSIGLTDFDFNINITRPYSGKNKFDLIKDNFCPIHSYIIKTSRIKGMDLYFNEDMSRLEDYDFLLRYASIHPCSFGLLNISVGAYSMRTNTSNTTPDWSDKDDIRAIEWQRNSEILKRSRSKVEIKLFASDFS